MMFAATMHMHQTRKDPQKTPYINHPLAVARILAEVGIRDLATLQAALLHDTLEDTVATGPELEVKFGKEVRQLVDSLTDDDSMRPMERKLVQLRGVKALPLKAKLVRIADKLNNACDVLNPGIPGWSQTKSERYVAWACEMVHSLKGTHPALEERFHANVSLPTAYAMGDWQKAAEEQLGEETSTAHFTTEQLADSSSGEGGVELAEQRAVLSLLRAAEFVAQQGSGERKGCMFLESIKLAALLAQKGIRDPETLKSALLFGSADGNDNAVAREYGNEVALILRSLKSSTPATLLRLPQKAKLILLGKELSELRELQIGTLKDAAAEESFRNRIERAMEMRELLRGTHKELGRSLDSVFNGQVRLASGQLTDVNPDAADTRL